MDSRVIFFNIFLLIFHFSSSQIPVGHYIDAQGWPIVGYVDPMEYSSNVQISHSHIADDFNYGLIITKSGKKIEGYVKMGFEVHFKFENSKRAKVNLDTVSAIVIESDSFLVTNKIAITSNQNQLCSYERGINQTIKYLTSFDGVDFAIFFDECTSKESQAVYLMKPKEGPTWLSVPEVQAKFDYMMNYTDSVKIQMKYNAEDKVDPYKLIKQAAYKQKHLLGDPIYFDDWWGESNTQTDRYAKVVSLDSMITLEYYEKHILVNRTVFKFEFPLEREGLSEWFYSSGVKRKETFYKNNEPLYVKEFFENEKLHYNYHIVKQGLEKFNTWNKHSLIRYVSVNDESGNSVLDNKGNGTEVFEDSHNSRVITRNYINRVLSSSHYESENRRIYQPPGTELDIDALQGKWNRLDVDDLVENCSPKDAATYFLVSAMINPQGYLSDYKVLNVSDSSINVAVNDFFSRTDLKCKKLNVENKTVKYEVIIPLLWKNSSDNIYEYQYWNHQFMMDLQLMQPNFTPINPPTSFR